MRSIGEAADVDTFAVVPRCRRPIDAFGLSTTVTDLAAQVGLAGVLYFTGAGAPVDPWAAAVTSACHHRELQPIVAVNPTHALPSTVAQLVNSIAHLHGRSVALNYIAGTVTSDRDAIGDGASHDRRYERLVEHATIVRALLASPRPVTFLGEHFQVERLQLLPSIPTQHQPRWFLAGESTAAAASVEQIDAVRLRMLGPHILRDTQARALEGQSLHVGLIARPDREDARRAAEARFPADQDRSQLREASMANTDAVWKQTLLGASADAAEPSEDGLLWLGPMRGLQTDCPYLVGDVAEVAAVLQRCVDRGAQSFLFEIPPTIEDFEAASTVSSSLRSTARRADAQVR